MSTKKIPLLCQSCFQESSFLHHNHMCEECYTKAKQRYLEKDKIGADEACNAIKIATLEASSSAVAIILKDQARQIEKLESRISYIEDSLNFS